MAKSELNVKLFTLKIMIHSFKAMNLRLKINYRSTNIKF